MRPNHPLPTLVLLLAGAALCFADSCDIVIPPLSVTTQECQQATFTVIANAVPTPSFTWLKNGAVVATNAGPVYTTAPLSAVDDGSLIQVIVTAGTCLSTSAAAILIVSPDTVPPSLLAATANCASNSVKVRFSELVNVVEASETANYSIPGLVIFGAILAVDGRSVTLDVSPLTANSTYTLTVANVSDLCAGNPIPAGSQLSFQCSLPPQILTQPVGQVGIPGSNVLFNVVADGTPPLRYIWIKDGRPIAGAAGPNYQLNNVQLADMGYYSVLISNASGSVLSAPAKLAVLSSYQLTLPPGFSPIANQLSKGNNTVPLVLPSVSDGTYLLKWLPALQTFSEANTYLDALGWTDPSMTLAPGEGAFIYLPSAGPTVLNFDGEFGPASLPLPLSPGYNLVSRQNPLPARYRDIVGLDPIDGSIVDQFHAPSDSYRTRTYVAGRWRDVVPEARVGEAVWVSHVDLPVITQQPLPLTNAPIGSNPAFTVGVSGTPPFRFQWRRNGVSIPGATNATFSIPNAQLTNAGSYTVAIQSGRVGPASGSQAGKVEDVTGAVVSLPAPLKFNTVDFAFSDSFAGQQVVAAPQAVFTGNNSAASREPGETNHNGKFGGHSTWIAWMAPTGGIATIHTLGSAFDTLLAVYAGSGFGTEVASDDDSGPFLTSEVSFNVTSGGLYYIAVDGFAGASGNFVLNLKLLPTTELLPVILRHPQNLLVDLDSTAFFSVSAVGPALEYQWLLDGQPVPSTSTSNSYSFNSVRDTDAGIYSVRVSTPFRSVTSRGALLQIKPTGPAPLKSPPGSPLPDTATDPELFALDKFADLVTEVTNSALASPAALPPFKVNVVAHGFSGTQIFSTIGSSKEPEEPNHADIRGGKSEWFAYQPTNHGTLRINTDGSTFDTVLAVYVGPGDSFLTLTNVGSDNNSGSNGLTSRVVFNVTSNTIYWIAVDGVNHPVTGVAASGSVHLNYRLALPLMVTNLAFSASTNNGRLMMKVNGTPNLATILETTANLTSPVWTPIFTNTTVSGSFTYTNTNGFAFTNRLIRAVNNL